MACLQVRESTRVVMGMPTCASISVLFCTLILYETS